jgi:hypothetical protein
MLKIYKNQGNGGNGEFIIQTDIKKPDEFLSELANATLIALEANKGDEDFTLSGILTNAMPIYLKLNGYKAETVYEETILACGYSKPEECTLQATVGVRQIGGAN